MTGVLCCQSESGECIGDDVRGRCEVFTGSGGEGHDTVNAGEHILGLPSGHRHVVHGGRSFRGRELGFFTHFSCLVPEGLQIVSGRTGHSRHLCHSGIEVGSGLYCRRSEANNSKRSGHYLVTDSGNLVTDCLELATDLFNFGKGGIGGDSFLLQTSKLLLGLDDFPLQSIILVLPEVTVFELFLCLPLCLLQRVQLFGSRADGFLEVFLLLGEKLCVGGV